MKTTTIKILLLTLTLQAFGQKTSRYVDNAVKFDTIISNFKKRNYSEDTIRLPFIHNNKNYSIEISNNPLQLDLKQIVVKNPFDSKYPISYSVIYKDRLTTLFEQGSFICQSTSTFERDLEFEKTLNIRKFQYFWLLGNKLVGLSDKKYYSLNNENVWIEYKNDVPFSSQPKLFEDDNYISFCDCQGEWGGTIYFYNKLTKKTHFTEATCANSVIKKDNKYYVLSKLGHGSGSTELDEIANPDNLPTVELKTLNNTFQGQAIGYNDTSKFAKSIFSYYDIQIFAAFEYNVRTLYLVNWRDETFLAEIENNVIKIVNPLFNKEFYTHNPITTTYDKTTLINFDFYGIADDREVYCIIIKDGKLTKLNWNEKHIR
jgi:hypothetical protein